MPMKLIKILLSSCFLFSSIFSSSALANTQATVPEQQTEVKSAVEKVVISDKVNINTATATEIQKALVGIGTKKAEAIVQYRDKHGPFTAIEQLMEVQGIGKATLEKNKDRITL